MQSDSFFLHVRRTRGTIIIMNVTTEYTDPYPFDDFSPTLSQCFVLVTVGYLFSRFGILTASDVKGVISLANYFAMPGIICVSLMDADFSDFRWELVFGVFLAKFLTFVVVAVFWIMLKGDIGVAGVLALFCTQSNDLPVGNPLMSSLYKDYRPHMMKYLFLIPAMTVIVFVPVSNIMVSVHRKMRKKSTPDDPCVGNYWWKCIRNEDFIQQLRCIAKHPVVIATLCGLFLNFVLKAPEILHQPIKVAAATIPGIALVMLGFSFVRKERYLLSSAFVPAAILLILKIVITPIMLHGILRLLTKESSNFLSDFALLYGIVSPATTVFLSGQEFRKALAVMSVALILSSFICFPVSYVVARATIAPVHKFSSYVPALKKLLFWTACISFSCDVITAITLMWKNHYKQTSYILYLIFTQAITCCGMVLWNICEKQSWSIYSEMVLYYGGEISGYIWTGTLAVVLVFRNRNWILAKQGFLILSCTAFSVSAIITTVMCLLIPYNAAPTVYVVTRARSNFELLQLIMTSILSFTSLTVVATCLIFHFKRSLKNEGEITEDCGYDNVLFYIEGREKIIQTESSEELTWAEKVQEKTKGVNETFEQQMKDEESKSSPSLGDREWSFTLSSLLILLGLTAITRFIANLFKLCRSKSLEVMIPLEFLQSTLFIGQGVFILLTFGVDVRTFIIRLRRWCGKVIRGRDDMEHCTGTNEKDEVEIEPFCHQFCKFYHSRCFSDIAKERRWKGTVCKNSFWGHQLVDWMITEGLCQDDVDAEGQGQKLLEGGVIKHVFQKHEFYDAPYLYQFVKGLLDSNAVKKTCKKF